MEQYGERDTGRAMERLRKVQQTGYVREFLARLNNAVAGCVFVPPEDKLKYFVEGLHPEIRRLVYACRPGNLWLATRLWADVETDKRRRGEHPGVKKDRAIKLTHNGPPVHIKENLEDGYAPQNPPTIWSHVEPPPYRWRSPPPMRPGRGIVTGSEPGTRYPSKHYQQPMKKRKFEEKEMPSGWKASEGDMICFYCGLRHT